MNTAASSGTQFQSQSDQAAVQAYAIPVDNAETIAQAGRGGPGLVHRPHRRTPPSSASRPAAAARAAARAPARVTPAGSAGSATASGFGGFGGQGDGSGTNGSGTSSGVTIAGRPGRLPGGQRRPDRGRHDHLGWAARRSPRPATSSRAWSSTTRATMISISWLDQSGHVADRHRDPWRTAPRHRRHRVGAGTLQPAPYEPVIPGRPRGSLVSPSYQLVRARSRHGNDIAARSG